jgi:transcriptional regulator with XRE-family HTH domain
VKTPLSRFRSRALRRPSVRQAYEGLEDEFDFLDQVLRARARSGLTQADVAARVGTTQSAIARLESGARKHSPSIATLQRYARALGFRLEIRLIDTRRSAGARRSGARAAGVATPARRP